MVRTKVVLDKSIDTDSHESNQPIFYIVKHQSASDLLALKIACKRQKLPDPLSPVTINNQQFSRTLCLEKPTPILKWRKARATHAIEQGQSLLEQHELDAELDAKLIPANLVWGRTPTVEKNNANVGTLLADQESPSILRKFFIVLFSGRHALVRLSQPLAVRYMADNHGTSKDTAHKLLRVARVHFHRQTVAATGPRLMHRQQMFHALMANPAVKKLVEDEAKNKGISEEKVKQQALKIMDEIAGDYRESMIHFGERVLSWLWNKLYKGIEVKNGQRLRDLAQDGHEIIYVPCHRSHMDYLLLTYVIFHEGLVTPRIAAGINLNFWPAGPIFRKAGAFFIRRSFRGNRLYSTIFREYLGLLFDRGYAVKYYTEGGRSRTGRLLAPKTGMLAMTIQSLLRGVDRPLTLVPVYIGYEHVMEVSTYHKELRGSKKQGESVSGVFKAIKKLRNYGKGYVNFGEPINVNQFLNDNVPDWKEAIDPIDPQKPSWLTPSVNVLADQVMTKINESAALNGVALIALILLVAENNALTEAELIDQIDFLLNIQRKAPYSPELTMPDEDAKSILEHIKSLNKLTIDADDMGNIISLTGSTLLEMTYYRNNIIHTYIIPAIICRFLDRQNRVNHQQLVNNTVTIATLFKSELFLWHNESELTDAAEQCLAALADMAMIKQCEQGYWSIAQDHKAQAQVHLLGAIADESLQRLAVVCTQLKQHAPITKSKLEEQVVKSAKRLSRLNNINAPEFTDKKVQSNLINALKEHGYIVTEDKSQLMTTEQLLDLKQQLANVLDIEVLQSIVR